MAAYFIIEVDITDPSWGPEYGEKVGPLVAKHGGKVIARSTEPARLEGERPLPTVVVMLEFPTPEAVQAWHSDPEYKPLIDLRNTGSTAEALLIDGL
jgi:uncharacterized protein (DUF1330 family)